MALNVLEVARRDLVICNPSDRLASLAGAMVKRRVGSVLIRKGNEVVGIVTKNDLLRAFLSGRSWEDTSAENVMSQPVATCNAEDTLNEALDKFENTRYSRLAVRDRTGRIVGVVKRKIVQRFVRVSTAHGLTSRRIVHRILHNGR